jgi:hypothetical protein
LNSGVKSRLVFGIKHLPAPQERIRGVHQCEGGSDHPPALIVWRKVRHKVTHADGPERIAPEWWAGDTDGPSRDYYRLETDRGGRFWVYRDAPATEGGRWWLHGFFA